MANGNEEVIPDACFVRRTMGNFGTDADTKVLARAITLAVTVVVVVSVVPCARLANGFRSWEPPKVEYGHSHCRSFS